MNLEQLEHVIEIVETGSLTKAADNLHVSLSAISQSITKLEKELGIQLFIRNRHGASPTFEGEKVIEKATEVILKVKELKEEANKYSESLSGELKIGMIPGPINLLIDMVSGFKSDYPNVKVEIYEKGPMEIMEEVYYNRLDLGLILASPTLEEDQKKLHFDKLFEGRMVAGVHKHSPLANLEIISPQQLITNTLVLYDDEYINKFATEMLSEYGPINILFTTNNIEAIKRAVQKRMAITVGMDYSFKSNQPFQTADIIPVSIEEVDQERVYFSLVRRDGKVPSQIIKEFTKRIKSEF